LSGGRASGRLVNLSAVLIESVRSSTAGRRAAAMDGRWRVGTARPTGRGRRDDGAAVLSITEVSGQAGGCRERRLTDVAGRRAMATADDCATVKLNREAWIDQFLPMIVASVVDAMSSGSGSNFRRRAAPGTPSVRRRRGWMEL